MLPQWLGPGKAVRVMVWVSGRAGPRRGACPEESSLIGQGWGPAGLRRLQQSSWEDSSVERSGGPWAGSLDLGLEGAGLGGWGAWYS